MTPAIRAIGLRATEMATAAPVATATPVEEVAVPTAGTVALGVWVDAMTVPLLVPLP